MFPISTLSNKYVLASPALPSIPTGKVRYVRIVAVQDGTELTYDPPMSGIATSLAHAGDFVEIPMFSDNVVVSATHRVLVAQYMAGQAAGGASGDPAMALAVPTDQFRSDYLFHAPISYETNFVDVVAKAGVEVMLDGQPVTGFTPIGA